MFNIEPILRKRLQELCCNELRRSIVGHLEIRGPRAHPLVCRRCLCQNVGGGEAHDFKDLLNRAHDLLNPPHDLLNRSYDLLNRSYDMYTGTQAPSTSRSAPSAPLRRSQIVTEKIKGSPLPGPASLLHSWLPCASLPQ